MNFETIIIDEAHRCGNVRTKTHKALKKICEGSNHRYLNSATPIMNKIPELYGILDIIQPGVCGQYHNFLEKYTVRNQWGGVLFNINQQDLEKKLKRWMVRKSLEEVAPELPSMIIEDIKFDLSDKEQDLYDKLRKEILFEVERSLIDKIEKPMLIQQTLVKLLVLSQLVCSMEMIGSDKTSTKIEVLKERLEDVLVGNDKAIIFSRFKKATSILARELKEYKPLLLTGDITGEERANNIKKFQEDDSYKILLSTDAGGEGLNIDRANIIFHFSLPYSYGKYIQRNGRIKRLTQKKPMVVYNLIAAKTVDAWLSKMINTKAKLSDTVLGDTPVTMQDIQSMLNV